MTDAPERIYMDPDIKFPECEKQYSADFEYIRADIVTDMVYSGIMTYDLWFELQNSRKTNDDDDDQVFYFCDHPGAYVFNSSLCDF